MDGGGASVGAGGKKAASRAPFFRSPFILAGNWR